MSTETIEVNDSNKPAILELFNKSVDADGFIIEKKTGKRVIREVFSTY